MQAERSKSAEVSSPRIVLGQVLRKTTIWLKLAQIFPRGGESGRSVGREALTDRGLSVEPESTRSHPRHFPSEANHHPADSARAPLQFDSN